MNTLRKVGYFFEQPLDERAATLRALVRATPHPNEQNILKYLDAGTVYGVQTGVEQDILSASKPIIGAVQLKTDGVWAWPQSLVYYVRQYHIALPDEFVSHMAVHAWKCNAAVDLDQLMVEGEVEM